MKKRKNMLPTQLRPEVVELIQKASEAEVKLNESIRMVREIKKTTSAKVFEDLTDGNEFGLTDRYSLEPASNSTGPHPFLALDLKPTSDALIQLYNANFELMMALVSLELSLNSSKQRKRNN